MNSHPTDPLRSVPLDVDLSPVSVSRYLAASGWQLDRSSEIAELWESPDREANLLLPLATDLADFRVRFREALAQLGAIHDWDSQQLATNVLGARSDILYVRALQNSADGSIPLDQAEQLIGGAQRLLRAAALSTVSPKSSYSGRRPDIVREFVDDLRMGHTQRGSFVITIITRLSEINEGQRTPPATVSGPDRDAEPGVKLLEEPPAADSRDSGRDSLIPFERSVMSTLATGTDAARTLALETGELSLDEGIRRGVSVELVNAIEDMTEFQGLSSLDLTFGWAPAEQRGVPEVQRVVIDREIKPALPRLAERLTRPTPAPEEGTDVFGRVIRLERGTEDNTGIATIEGTVGDERSVRRIKVQLSGRSYNAAITAHRNRSPVAVRGTFEKLSSGWWLTGPDVTLS